jgi:O-acetylhomoserine (thiol)-lyase
MAAPRFSTLSLHAGAAPDPATGARATPIYETASFVFRDADHAAALFNLERAGHVSSRISNPTVAVFEERVAALEDGAGAIATASGQAALHLAIATLMGAGSHIVASSALHGGSHSLLHHTLRRFGIETTFVHPRDHEAWRTALRPNTRLLFGETLANPSLDLLDIETIAAIAHAHRVPLLVDSTLTTPYLLKPFAYGADFIYHCATGLLGGHGTTVGGVLVDGGTFAFELSGKFPEFTGPYEGLSGMVFADECTVAPFLLRARHEGLRDFGACMHPPAAWQLLQGIETLALRMDRHVANTRRIVEFLAAHPAVASVAYPELDAHPDHALAARLMPKGCGAVLSFELRGDGQSGRRCIEALAVISHGAHVGEARSLVIHPASTTHRQMDAAALAAAGINEGTLRLSIGLEDADDLIEDLKHALKASQRGPKWDSQQGATHDPEQNSQPNAPATTQALP